MSVKTIEQSVPSGSNFTGAAPTTAPVATRGTDMFISPIEAGNGAGEFDFGNDQPWYIQQIFIKLGGQTTYNIIHVDRNGVTTTLFTGGTEAVFLSTPDIGNTPAGMLLLEGEKLRITTTGTTINNIIARVSADQYRL